MTAKKKCKDVWIKREDEHNPNNNNVNIGWTGPSLAVKKGKTPFAGVKEYSIELWYTTETNKVFVKGPTTTSLNGPVSLTAPESSIGLYAKVKPVSKSEVKNDKKKVIKRSFSGQWIQTETDPAFESPWIQNQNTTEAQNVREKCEKPTTPSLSSAEYRPASKDVLVKFSNSSENSDRTWVRRYANGGSTYTNVTNVSRDVTQTVDSDVSIGDYYNYAVIAHNKWEGAYGGVKVWSDMSSLSSPVEMPPIAPSDLKAKSTTNSSVVLSWTDGGHTGNKYQIAYSDDAEEIKKSGSSMAVRTTEYEAFPVDIGNNRVGQSYTVNIDDGGKQWYFRVRRQSAGGWSNWSGITSAMVGKVPSAPVTYATQPYVAGETVLLRWAYVNTDGSEQQNAQIVFTGGIQRTVTVNGSSQYYELDISSVENGTEISWKVRCAGVVKDGNNPKYGDYSAVKKFTVVTPPVLSVDDGTENGIMTGFPLAITANSSAPSRPVSYYAQIACGEDIPTTRPNGTEITLREGSVIWSEQKVTSETGAVFTVLPADIQLEDDKRYVLTVTVASSYGLRTTEERDIVCSFAPSTVSISANVEFDEDGLFAVLEPECYDCVVEDGEIVVNDDMTPVVGELSDCKIHIWRADAYGNWELIAENLDNSGEIAVVDPHPTLGTCLYRICAVDNTTGAIDYEDVEDEFRVKGIVIDIDGRWGSEYDEFGEAEWKYLSDRIILPTNIAVTEESDPDMVELELWGDDAPTLRNGTHLRIGGSWSCSFYKRDNDELIAGLRRLMAHVGSVYVREPGGVGYWAKCKVSMSRSYDSVGMDVSMTVTRVKSPNAQEGAVNA